MGVSPGPYNDSKNLIKVRCFSEFEPHGRASETWDFVWEMEFPEIHHHWMSTTGYRPGNKNLSMVFRGKTFEEVYRRAKHFLEWYNES
jgi:hypothetical protein